MRCRFKSKRRRFVYTETDQLRWLSVGALIVASAATLGYIYGRYSEKYKKNGGIKAKHKGEMIEFERDYRIVIYGDSTTWGYDPDKHTRLETHERYPSILDSELNKMNKYKYRLEVLSEGLNGRTINHNDNDKLSMNGTEQILPILYSHKPIDIIIIMLGVNDCKARFNPSASKIANNMNYLIQQCINAEIWHYRPSIILISPPSIIELTINNKERGWNQSSIHISQSLHTQYAKIKANYDKDIVYFVNANDYIQTGSDSVHIDAANNIKLANALYPIIIQIINKLQKKSRKMSVPSFTSNSFKHIQQNNYNKSMKLHDKEHDEDVEDEDSLSELEQERNGNVVINDIEIDDTINIIS